MNVNEIVNRVVFSVKKEWSTLEKIRFVYLETGKYLVKDTDFFFSMDGKLDDYNLSLEELAYIYNNENPLESNKVICRSSALILKKIYDRLGIKSKLVKSVNNITEYKNNGNVLTVNHWMLVVYDESNAYFCTLPSDLPYIQSGMATKHFGVNIPYKKTLPNGDIQQVYDGEEIRHMVLSPEMLKKLDINVGYIKNYYSYGDDSQAIGEKKLQYDDAAFFMIRDALKANKLYYELEEYNTAFYKDLVKFTGSDGKIISMYDTDFRSLSAEDWQIWLKIMCKHVLDKINEMTGEDFNVLPPLENANWVFEPWLFSLCFLVQRYIYKYLAKGNDYIHDDIDLQSFKYSKWSRNLKRDFNTGNTDYDYYNILTILDKTNALVNWVYSGGKNGSFRNLLSKLAFHFIPAEHILENNISKEGNISNYYVANKFKVLFNRFFECNEGIRDFNKMEYSEQIVIIKEILNYMFQELTVEDSSNIENYNYDYSPIMNRINLYPLKSKSDGSYSLIFNIVSDDGKGDYDFLYDLKNNKFQVVDVLSIIDSYVIVSKRMKDKLSIMDIENVEESYNDYSYDEVVGRKK